MPMMGYREYARHRNCRLNAVQNAIKSGRIKATPDKRIDSEAADRDWAAMTDPAQQRKEPPAPPVEVLPIFDGVAAEQISPGLSVGPQWPEWSPEHLAAERAKADLAHAMGKTPGLATVVDLGMYQRAKAEREFAEAEMAKDRLAESRKQLINSSDAIKAFHAMGKMYSQGREAVPDQLAPRLVGLTDTGEIARIVREVLRSADVRIADEIKSQFAEIVRDRDVVAG